VEYVADTLVKNVMEGVMLEEVEERIIETSLEEALKVKPLLFFVVEAAFGREESLEGLGEELNNSDAEHPKRLSALAILPLMNVPSLSPFLWRFKLCDSEIFDNREDPLEEDPSI
jgi:hypothetical protein